MSRKPTNVEESSLELLKQFVRTKTNLACKNFYEIRLLQSRVTKDTESYISAQTLSRFFSLIKNSFHPSSDTLNILSRFVGYQSFDEFVFMNKDLRAGDTSALIHFVAFLFAQMDAGNSDEKKLLQVLKNIYRMISTDEKLFQEIHVMMARTAFGRNYFFQKLVNMDALDGIYGDGVKFLLLHGKKREEQLFGYCILCLRYLLTHNYDSFNFCYNKVSKHSLDEVLTYSPELIGRYLATGIYRQIMDKKMPEPVEEARHLLQAASSVAPAAFPYLQFFVAEALILGEEYAEAWKILNAASCCDEDLLNQYNLLKLFSGFFSQKIHPSRAKVYLQEVKALPFQFLCDNYYSIYLFTIAYCLEENQSMRRHLSDHIHELIKKTNFSHLYLLLDNELIGSFEKVSLMTINEKKTG